MSKPKKIPANPISETRTKSQQSPVALSARFIEPAFSAHRISQPTAEISLDLGISWVEVRLHPEGIELPDGELLSWTALRRLMESPEACFEVQDGELLKIQAYSAYTGRHYTLMSTERAPTLLISGIPMHRIKDTDPYADTLTKIDAIQPVVGQVLDTCTGLGYTAIQAAHSADQVTTIELDPTVMEIIRRNPWSQELLDNPKISQIFGDSYEVVENFLEGQFDRILHDPPTLSLAGELYSTDFYRQLYRVLKPGGILFHYIGDLDSRLGHRVARGAAQRLQEAGFRSVRPRKAAFGLVARK